ncbi:hypothetical protein SK128_013344 [Halocaridina rubra]|uniref:Uncharacterized protein n=1 Tax=Halocaridina rubra TaxID=373956 RepID=A0AAN9A7Q0_HALRR
MAFPFDVQICLLSVQLNGPGNPEINLESLIVTGGNTSLPAYRMPSVRCRPTAKEHVRRVELAILLERRGEAFLKSAIGPCLILGLLGHISFLAFPVDEFNERASTSLSLLIVVASLFSQAVSSLPASASSKAIDEWFFYFILRFFLFFLAQCLVEYQRRRLIKKQKSQVVPEIHAKMRAKNDFGRVVEHPRRSEGDEMLSSERHPSRAFWKQRDTFQDKFLLIQPSSVNMTCFVLGIFVDIAFVLIFCYNIHLQNSNIREQFENYEVCCS